MQTFVGQPRNVCLGTIGSTPRPKDSPRRRKGGSRLIGLARLADENGSGFWCEPVVQAIWSLIVAQHDIGPASSSFATSVLPTGTMTVVGHGRRQRGGAATDGLPLENCRGTNATRTPTREPQLRKLVVAWNDNGEGQVRTYPLFCQSVVAPGQRRDMALNRRL